MKKIVLYSVLIFFSSGLPVRNSRAEIIRIAYFEVAPHMYYSKEEGRPRGATIAYFEKVVEEMGKRVEWVGPLPFSRMVSLLKEGKEVDGTPLMSKTSERRQFLYYPQYFYYLARPNFVVRKNNPLNAVHSIEDVKGFVISQFNKAANSRFVTEHLPYFRFDKLSTGDKLFEQQLKKLILGRVDAIHTLDEYTILFEAERLKLEGEVKLLVLPESPWPFYSVFVRNERGKRLTKEFDAAFEKSGYRPGHYRDMVQLEFDRISKKEITGAPSPRNRIYRHPKSGGSRSSH